MENLSPKYQIRNVDPHQLIPWERNPRRHNMPALRESIERFGFRNVIVVNGRTNTIEAGHGRAQAAIDLGIETVPVLFVDDDDQTAAAYAIADNRQTEISGWDEEGLLKLLLELQEAGQEASTGVGYSDAEIADLLRKVEGTDFSGLDPMAEWQGMPEFTQDDQTAWKSLIVHFDSAENLQRFSALLGQSLTPRTRSIWYPQAEISHLVRQRYTAGGSEADIHEIEVKGVKAFVRADTSDEFVVREVIGGNEYRKLCIRPTDTVMDVGLNIGMASIWALRQGAQMVYSYEADDENFELAQRNLRLNGLSDKASLHNLAVIGTDDATREFSINVKKNKGAHSLIAKRGRDSKQVECVNINTLLGNVQPDVVKMDIEGGEYEVLKAIEDFSCIRELILEFHHAHLDDIKTHEKYEEILGLLRANFSHVESRDPAVIGGAWTGIIYCNRDN